MVGLLLRHGDSSEVEFSAGVHRYRQEHDLPWQIQSCWLNESKMWPASAYWLIHRVEDFHVIRRNGQQPRLPLIYSRTTELTGLTSACAVHEPAFGDLAAQHFYERGMLRVASIDIRGAARLNERIEGFAAASKRRGMEYHHLERPVHRTPKQIDRWVVETLVGLGGQVGVYCPIDGQAHWLRNLCLAHNINIPHQIAILGTSDHLATCLGTNPQLSSIAHPWTLMGYTLASYLHRVTCGQIPESVDLLQPHYVVSRESTAQKKRTVDPLVTQSLRWLRQHLNHPRPLEGLAAARGVATTTLHRHFKRDIGISPKQQQEVFRLEKAEKLLANPKLSITQVAKACGYNSPLAFGVAFKRRRNMPPSQWRSLVNINELSLS